MNRSKNASEKMVGSFRWPFFRYDVLVSEPIGNDSLVWLYLSLVLLKNGELRRTDSRRLLFDDIVLREVDELVTAKFSSLIDKTTLGKIKGKIQTERVYANTTENRSYLKDETLNFLKSEQQLFSDSVKTCRVFQDALTGEVVPYFDGFELDQIKDCRDDRLVRMQVKAKKEPGPEKIKQALIHYERLRIAPNPAEVDPAMIAFVDPDEEVDFEPETEFVAQEPRKFEIKPKNDFKFEYLENRRCEFNFKVDVFLRDKTLFVQSPFNRDLTNAWLNGVLAQARQSGRCDDLNAFFQDLEKTHLDSVKAAIASPRPQGVAEQLKHFGKVYELLETISVEKNAEIVEHLKDELIDLDARFQRRKSKDYYVSLGRLLEYLIMPFRNNRRRKPRHIDLYNVELERIARKTNVDLSRLIGNATIFNEWLRCGNGFKSQVADIVLSNRKFSGNGELYRDFINDLFALYDARNSGGAHASLKRAAINPDDIEKIYRVAKVLINLY